MIDLLKYVFSNFWIFIGTVILISVVFDGIVEIIQAIKKNKH